MGKKILVKLQGGLGNQLFQYSCGLAVAKKFKSELYADLSDFRKGRDRRDFTLRDFDLDKITGNIKTLPPGTFSYYSYPLTGIRYLKFIIKRFLNLQVFISITESGYPLLEKINVHRSIYLKGYWQNEKYFKEIRNDLLEEFHTAIDFAGDQGKFSDLINSGNESVSIHVRRGDYISNPVHRKKYELCGIDYFERAIELMKSRLKAPVFFIFSDDMDWVKNNLKLPGIVYMEKNSPPWVDLLLMKTCKHQIIANSSFSWWAAWLNENPDKIVIAPARWFRDRRLNEDRKDIVPPEWIRL